MPLTNQLLGTARPRIGSQISDRLIQTPEQRLVLA